MVWFTQRHLFVINGSHLHGEPVKMLVLHFQSLNRRQIMHLHLNATTDNTSFTQIASGKFIGPTYFQPIQSNRTYFKFTTALLIGRLIESDPSNLVCELTSHFLEWGYYSAKLKLLSNSKSATVTQVVYHGTQTENIVPKTVVLQQTAPIIVLDNICIIKVDHRFQPGRPDTILAFTALQKSADP